MNKSTAGERSDGGRAIRAAYDKRDMVYGPVEALGIDTEGMLEMEEGLTFTCEALKPEVEEG